MNDTPQIAVIGPGAIAEAIISGLIRKKVTIPENIIAAGPRQERLDELIHRYLIRGMVNNSEAAASASVIVISVKPQRLDVVLRGLRGHLKPDALILSVVAGATIARISTVLGHNSIVRSMPNTPAQIGQGITVWTASPEVTPEQRDVAGKILSAMGEDVFMEEEYYLDMATALSGTGPAYVFLFMEAMVDAGVHLGFPRRIAEQLVAQTMLGSVNYYKQKHNESGESAHIANLRNQVTSPGGTSAAALYYLEKAGFRTAISRAVWAAFERSQELGKDKKVKMPDPSSPQD